jgi:2-keto-4-pentenoate hydratase
MTAGLRARGFDARAWAQRLLEAERQRKGIAPPTDSDSGISISDAYEIQREGLAMRLADGSRTVGRKVGLTSHAMQEMLGVHQPDFGYLLEEMVLPSGSAIAMDRLIAPRVEGEIAFVIGERLKGPGISHADVLEAAAEVAPALEVIDSRVVDWRITISDTIADNASCGMAVVGDRIPVDGHDLAAVEMSLVAGTERVVGRGAAVLGHPAEAVAWLANELAAYGDEALEDGELILPGALGRALPVAPGVIAVADFGVLGRVEATFQ